jgi:uncharacterized membrane protein YdjX (TVP38/TMEM64 family)/rhodanese-related sulfurtransferase
MTLRTVLPRLALGLAIIAGALWLALNRSQVDPALIENAMRDLGAWGPAAHVALFGLGTVLFVPGVLFALAGGLLFGPLWGTILNLAGATLGATAAFLAARYLGGDWVRRRAGGRLDRLIAGVEAEGWRFVAFVRLVPLVPFNLLNYALGLTRIPLVPYVMASLVCMIPGAVAYTWLGYAGREAAAGNVAAIRYGLLALGLLAAIALLPRLVQRLRGAAAPRWIAAHELAAGLDEAGGITVVDVRGPEEFTGPLGHIREARNLPVGELPQRLHDLGPLRSTQIVLVCHTDKRSAKAAATLSEYGFQDVRVLRGGMVRWTEAGMPVADRLGQHRS